jgi:mannose-6-phosphate isomerase-like protein (cupin superfamily)
MVDFAKSRTPGRMRQFVQPIKSAKEVCGRREFFTYRDLGLKEATDGRIGGMTMAIRKAMNQSTGWHYHTCEAQINYCLKGWADVVFEDGTQVRIKAGDLEYIPGGLIHNEVATSDDLETIEICIPAEMGTIAVDPPEWWLEQEMDHGRSRG